MFIYHKNKVDEKWYKFIYADVRISNLDSKDHYRRYGIKEERVPNPFCKIKSIFFRNFFLFLSSLNIRIYENGNFGKSKLNFLIKLFFQKEYRFLKNAKTVPTKFYFTSWVGGGVSDALEFYIRKDLEKFENIIVFRSLKNISNQFTPIFKVEVYSKNTAVPSVHTCPFPYVLLASLFADFHYPVEIDVHHVFGFEQLLDFILNNFATKLNFFVHDYYIFSGNWSFFNVNILPKGVETIYFETEINTVWSYTSRKFFLTKCTSIIATSYHTFKLLSSERDFPTKKLKFNYIPEESNLESIQLISRREAPRKIRNVKIIVLGNLGIYKGLTLLNNIVDELESEHFDFSFFHFGGVSEGELNNKIVAYGWLEKRKRQIEIDKLSADIALLPAQSPETYSMILSELIRINIPIVSSKIGALTERLFDRKNAHLVNNYTSSQSWVKEIIDFCENNYLDSHLNSDFDTDEAQLILHKRARTE